MMVSRIHSIYTYIRIFYLYLAVDALVIMKPDRYVGVNNLKYAYKSDFIVDFEQGIKIAKRNVMNESNEENIVIDSEESKEDTSNGQLEDLRNLTKINVDERTAALEEERIVGGHPVNITDMPSYVLIAIYFPKRFNTCGGNLITQKHVITAAHCVVEYRTEGKRVRFKVLKPSQIFTRVGSSYMDQDGSVIKSAKICVHPDHTGDLAGAPNKDVSIITMKHKVNLSDSVRTAPIHPYMTQKVLKKMGGKKCTVAGWGVKKAGAVGIPRILHKTQVTLITPAQCKDRYDAAYDQKASICALDLKRDSCQGDSGGGLFCDDSLTAVVSWGEGCGEGHPGVYARVDNIEPFIKYAVSGSCLFPSQRAWLLIFYALIVINI